jgi:uroporphyrinogen III methyltransferase/synthase
VAHLAGQTILITRAAGQAGELARQIERRGGVPIIFPTIGIRPPESWKECDLEIGALSSYDGIIFTSANGVKYFFGRCIHHGLAAGDLRSKLICVVGEQTRRAAKRLGFTVTTMPEKYSALDLAGAMGEESLKGKRYLFPRSNLGDDALAENFRRRHAHVHSVVVYRTVRPDPEGFDRVRTMLLRGEIDVVTFTSPSTFGNFASFFSTDEIEQFRPLTRIAAIGPATAAAIKQSRMAVDIFTEQASVGSLIESICRYFAPASRPAGSTQLRGPADG